jgi:hypothetical protein
MQGGAQPSPPAIPAPAGEAVPPTASHDAPSDDEADGQIPGDDAADGQVPDD